MVFELPIIEEKIKMHQVTALHLTASLAFIGTGAIVVVYNYTIPYWGAALLVLGISILIATIFKNKWLVTPKVSRMFRVAELILALCVEGYSFYQQWKFPMVIFGGLNAALLFSLFWEHTAGETLFVLIDAEGIKLPVTSRKRYIGWNEVEQVLLRYGTISINCIDNRMFQWHIGDVEVDGNALESFSNLKIEEYKGKRFQEW